MTDPAPAAPGEPLTLVALACVTFVADPFRTVDPSADADELAVAAAVPALLAVPLAVVALACVTALAEPE